MGLGFGAPNQMDQQHAGFKPAHAESQLGKNETGNTDGHQQTAAADWGMLKVVGTGGDFPRPLLEQGGMGEQIPQAGADDDKRQRQEGRHEDRGQSHHLLVALEKHAPQQQQERHGHQDLVLHPRRSAFGEQRIVDQMRSSIGGRECLGDHKIGGRKADQHQHTDLARPAPDEAFDHADRSDAVGRFPGDIAVHRIGPQQRHQHQHQRGNGGQRAGPFEGDRRLIAERAEVIHTAQAHDQPPRIVVITGRLAHAQNSSKGRWDAAS